MFNSIRSTCAFQKFSGVLANVKLATSIQFLHFTKIIFQLQPPKKALTQFISSKLCTRFLDATVALSLLHHNHPKNDESIKIAVSQSFFLFYLSCYADCYTDNGWSSIFGAIQLSKCCKPTSNRHKVKRNETKRREKK